MRHLDDALILHGKIIECKQRSGTAIVVGGGYVGAEVASAIASHGIQVKYVFTENVLLSSVFDTNISPYFEDTFEKNGVEILKKSGF